MNTVQKTIKYLAMAFAIFLAISIVSAIASTVFAMLHITSREKQSSTEEISYSNVYTEDIESISIDTYLYTVEIKQGNDFRVDLDNVSENYKAEVVNKTLKLRYEGASWDIFSWFNKKSSSSTDGKVIICVPPDYPLKSLDINGGIGNLVLNDVICETLDMDLGTGSIEGSRITTTEETSIDCGAGSIHCSDVVFKNLSLDTGIGKSYIHGDISGESEINGGVGEINLGFQQPKDNYNIRVDNGVGEISVDGDSYTNYKSKNLDAINSLDIDGGVGAIILSFGQQSE